MENFKKFVYKFLKSGKMKDKYINLLLDQDSNLKLYQDALYSENDYEPYYILGKVTYSVFLQINSPNIVIIEVFVKPTHSNNERI